MTRAEILQSLGAPAVVGDGNLRVVDYLLRMLANQEVLLAQVTERMDQLAIQARAAPVGDTTVEWRGRSGDYFANMEAINHEIAQELFRAADSRPDAPSISEKHPGALDVPAREE